MGTTAPEASICSQLGHQVRNNPFGDGAHPLKACCWPRPRGSSSADTRHHASWFAQFRWLYWRSMVISMRNPLDMGARVLASAWLGVLEGLVFLHLGYGKLPQGLNMRGRKRLLNHAVSSDVPAQCYMAAHFSTGNTCNSTTHDV